jgi:hypothetical protein
LKRLLANATFVLVLTAVALAQATLTGKWQGDTPGGSRVVLNLTATDTALTGTLSHNDETIPIVEGKVSKNTFTFKATLHGDTQGFTGEFAGGDELKVWMDKDGPDKQVILKRAKS